MDIHGILYDTISTALEEIAFLDLEPVGEMNLAEAFSDLVYVARVSMDDDKGGDLTLILSSDMAAELTISFLGGLPESEDHLVLIRDGVGELVNIIAGNLFPYLLGAKTDFILKAPEVTLQKLTELPANPHAVVVNQWYDSEGEIFVAQLGLTGEMAGRAGLS